MNSSVTANEKFKFEYSSFEYTDSWGPLLKLANQYYQSNPINQTMNQQLDTLCAVYEREKDLSIKDIKERITDTCLLQYLEVIFEETIKEGIKSSMYFGAWLQGNHRVLNHPSPQLYPHTHLYNELPSNTPIMTHTVIIPLQINNEITETFWAKWVDDLPTTIPPRLKILMSLNKDRVSDNTLRSAFNEWWNNLEKNGNNEMLNIKLPDKGEKLTFNFDSRNYIHGISNLSDNLYLIAVFDGCKK
jgi:hypothetical protein